jgi:hypothetical protein
VLEFLLVAGLVLVDAFAWPLLLVLLNIPAAIRVIGMFGEPPPAERPADFPVELWPLWFAHQAFALNRRFAALFLAGLLLGIVIG